MADTYTPNYNLTKPQLLNMDPNWGFKLAGNFDIIDAQLGARAGFRNRILNGNFDIWQRGTSFSVANTTAYTADRFQVTSAGATSTVSRTALTVGGQASQNAGAKYGLTITGASGLSYIALLQGIEGVNTFEGKQVTVSIFSDKAMPAGAYIRAQQVFGSGGSATVTTDTSMSSAAAGSDYVWTATFTLPSISGKTIGTSDYLLIQIIYVPPVVTTAYTFYGYKIDPGSVRTITEVRDPALELLACMRYYQLLAVGLAGIAISSSGAYLEQSLPAPMRAAPTIGNPTAAVTVNDGSVSSTQSAAGTATTINSTTSGVVFQLVNFSGLTTNRPLIVTGGGSIPLNADF